MINYIRSEKGYRNILILFVIFILVMNIMAPYVADDYGYFFNVENGKNINNILDIIYSQINQYTTANGRVTAHFFVQLFMQFDKIVFDIVNTGITISYTIVIMKIAKIKENKMLYFLLLVFLFNRFVPSIGQCIFWLTGSINYLWNTLFCIILIYMYINKYENKIEYNIILFSFLSFFAGAANENLSVSIIFFSFCMLVLICYKNKKILISDVIPFLCLIFGFLFMVTAPGNSVRMETSGGSFQILELLGRVLPTTLMLLKTEDLYILIILIILGIIYLLYKKKCHEVVISILLLLTALCANYAMIATPFYPERAMFGLVTILLIDFIYIFNNLNIKSIKYVILMICLLTCNLKYTINGIIDYAYSSLESYKREIYINEQKASGRKVIDDLYWIGSIYKYSPYYGLEDIQDSPDFWVNRKVAKYYGIDQLYIK